MVKYTKKGESENYDNYMRLKDASSQKSKFKNRVKCSAKLVIFLIKVGHRPFQILDFEGIELQNEGGRTHFSNTNSELFHYKEITDTRFLF